MKEVREIIKFYYEKTGKFLSFAQAVKILREIEKNSQKPLDNSI